MRIAVYCGSSRRSPEGHLALARAVGAELVRRNHTLVYGGGKTGLMGAVADAVLDAGGRVEGVILDVFIDQGVHHEGLDELHVVTDMRSRKQGLDERADAFMALPGGLGTLEELAEILSFRKLALHHRPLVFLNAEGYYDPILEQLERGIANDFDKPAIREYWRVATTPEEGIRLCEEAAAAS